MINIVGHCFMSRMCVSCRLKLEAIHHSRLPRPRNAVTLMLTTSANRLHLLDDLCKSWPFPLAVAVYAPVVIAGNASDAVAAERAVQKATKAVNESYARCVARGDEAC